MRKMKRIGCFILSAAAFLFPLNVYAKIPDTITKEAIFHEFSPDATYPFAEIIQDGNSQYKLENVKYEVLKEDKITVSEDISIDMQSAPILEEEYYELLPTIEQNGITLNLVSSEKKEEVITTDIEIPYSTSVTYDYNVADEEIPDKKEIEIRGQAVELPLKRIVAAESKWIDTTINLIYSNYGADYYMFQGNQIPNTGQPALDGYESVILQSLGLPIDDYRITEIVWSSDPYSSEGTKYRDAVAKAKMLVNGKIAIYESDSVTLSGNKVMTTYTNHYEGTKVIDTGKAEYEIKAVANYKLYSTNVGWKTATFVLGFLFVLSVAISLILFLLSKNKQKAQINTMKRRNENG